VASATVNRLTLMIENYHDKLGFYPPANAGNSTASTPAAYAASTAQNQLLYELTGCSLVSTSGGVAIYRAIDGTTVSSTALATAYGRGGFANANPDEPHDFYYPQLKPSDYALYSPPLVPGVVLNGLVVTVPGTNAAAANFVHYDSSSPNRRNPGTFDLWVEYSGGTGTNGLPIILTNGNWSIGQ